MDYQNHVIDPTFFWDAIEEFSFNYNIYINTAKTVNEYGKRVLIYELQIIRGSLQSQGLKKQRTKSGNTTSKECKFYCKSIYRIAVDDILEYKNNFYIVNDVQDYDEYGCREATLSLIQLTAYKDLADYIKYLEGAKLV